MRLTRRDALLARELAKVGLAPDGTPAQHMYYWYSDAAPETNIVDFHSVNPLTRLSYRAPAQIDSKTTLDDIAAARERASSASDEGDEIEIFTIPLLDRLTFVASPSRLDTTHSLSNPRVTLDGDTATLEGIMACMRLPRTDHSRHVLMTNRYDVELVRQGDVWVIQHLTVDNAWTEGDPSVLSGI